MIKINFSSLVFLLLVLRYIIKPVTSRLSTVDSCSRAAYCSRNHRVTNPSVMSFFVFIMLTSATMVLGQRPFYAGSKPIGYPDTPNKPTTEALADRFGEVTTQRLPIEANGDRDLIDRISKLPVDQQPFWFINWQALEAERQNPQSYPHKPNDFVDPPSNTGNVIKNLVQPETANRNNFGSNNVLPLKAVTPGSNSATTVSSATVKQ